MPADLDRSAPPLPGVPLSEAIESLRSELDQALTAGEGKRVHFAIPEVTLVLTVGMTTEALGKAGVHWWVIDAGGSASYSKEQTQTLTLTLRPQRDNADGTVSDLRVGAADAESCDSDTPSPG